MFKEDSETKHKSRNYLADAISALTLLFFSITDRLNSAAA